MGVKGLQYFCEKVCTDVCQDVSIKDMADYHRRTCPGVSPILVVDGMCLINQIYKEHLDWICGGQWKEYIAALDNFIQRFLLIGVKLVFFFDGSVCPEKRREWVSRRIRKGREIEQLFDNLRRTHQEPDIEKFQPPTSIGTYTRFALKYGCGVEVYSTIREADAEVAEYALKETAVFAILAQDSDFLIYDTKPYVSMKHLNLNTLTSVLYDRERFAFRALLDVPRLPLLSALLGNDVIPVHMVKEFHRELCLTYGERTTGIDVLLPLVSTLIKNNNWTGNYQNDEELNRISMRVLGNCHGYSIELLRESLRFYLLTDFSERQPSAGIPEIVIRRHVYCENFTPIYGLLKNFEYECSEVLEDSMDESLPRTNLAFRLIRQRAYSILFCSILPRNQNHVVKEWCPVFGNPLSSPELVEPLPVVIPGRIPRIEELWCSNSADMKLIRIQCFCACLGHKLKVKDVQSILPQHLAVCCILNYLLTYGQIRRPLLAPFEVIAFIAQAVVLQTKTASQLHVLQVHDIEPRAVSLASIFMRGVATIAFVAGICGFPFAIEDFMPWKFFDGKLFHLMYLRARNGASIESLCEHKVDLIEQFYQLRYIVTLGTNMH